jgi:hypothetical protein
MAKTHIIGLQQSLLKKFPNQLMTISSVFGSITSIYSDEEFSVSGSLEYTTLGEIVDEVKSMADDATDAASNISSTFASLKNIYKAITKGASSGKMIASGFRKEATPWMGFKKAIAHTHGNITLNFVITRELGNAKMLLNKMSMQEIKYGMWKYDPTDVLSTLFDDFSSLMNSESAGKNGSSNSSHMLDSIDGKITPRLFSVKIGKWFKADKLVLTSLDYRIKTSVFDENGSPEYLTVTMNLEPIRKLSAEEMASWFPNLHNKKSDKE